MNAHRGTHRCTLHAIPLQECAAKARAALKGELLLEARRANAAAARGTAASTAQADGAAAERADGGCSTSGAAAGGGGEGGASSSGKADRLLSPDEQKAVVQLLLRLRQAAVHPQIGVGGLKGSGPGGLKGAAGAVGGASVCVASVLPQLTSPLSTHKRFTRMRTHNQAAPP